MAEEKKHELSIEEMAAFCKRKGFVYQNSEIYGGFAGFWDFGPLGVEVKNNLKMLFWKTFAQDRDDMAGIDGTIITHPKVWEASGHVDGFNDILCDCKKCGNRIRGDHLIEDALKMDMAGISLEKVAEIIKENNLVCPNCKGDLGEPKRFNLMFTTSVGAIKSSASEAYLRPETAQVIFTNFKLVQENARLKLPFGIIQTGKAFRNEISPRDFLFRSREFEQMEIEYFIHPEKIRDCPDYDEVKDNKLIVLTSDMQKNNKEHEVMKVSDLLAKDVVKCEWHAYWIYVIYKWFVDLGVREENLRLREHVKDELAHYAGACVDVEYHFPFGWKEIHGSADRTTFDLSQHIKFSKQDMSIFDEETKEKVVPHVIEPSQGVERAFLTFLFDAYRYDKERENVVLKLHPKLASFKVAIFPLVKKDKLPEKAREVLKVLQKEFNCFYDESGSVGRRYARQDEAGTPFCCTIDFDTLKDNSVTIRDRDSTKQIRVKIDDLRNVIRDLIAEDLEFEKAGKLL